MELYSLYSGLLKVCFVVVDQKLAEAIRLCFWLSQWLEWVVRMCKEGHFFVFLEDKGFSPTR